MTIKTQFRVTQKGSVIVVTYGGLRKAYPYRYDDESYGASMHALALEQFCAEHNIRGISFAEGIGKKGRIFTAVITSLLVAV